MERVHDLGGRAGYERIPIERDHPGPEARWQQRVFGLIDEVIARGFFNVDQFRHAVERVPQPLHFDAGYYGRWFAALEILLAEADLTPAESAADIRQAARRLLQAAAPPSGSARRSRSQSPIFEVGQSVRTRSLQRSGHCRLPEYARGKEGVVVLIHPAYVYPDTNAERVGEAPQYVYSVRFTARELWGESAEPNCSVLLDVFEPYLEGGGPDPADA